MRPQTFEQDEYARSKAAAQEKRKTYYRCTAKDIEGRVIRETLDAPDHDALYARLRDQGLYLQHAVRLARRPGKQLTARQLSAFCQELSSLLGAGVNLIRALNILTKGDLPMKQKILYQNILTEVEAGNSLADAMEGEGVFPGMMLGTIRSAEGSGSLDDVAARLAGHYTQEHKLRQQICSAMTYPCILAVLALAALIAIFIFILPRFEELFTGMGQLPVFTAALMAVSHFLVRRWYIALGGGILLAVLPKILLRIPALRFWLDRWKVTTCLLGIGKLNSTICTARFARTVSSLYSSGMPLVSALKAAGDAVGNRYLAGQFEAAAAKVCGGETLSASLWEMDGLQKKLCGAVQVGEETGRLDSMLEFAAGTMEYDSSQAGKRLITLLEPCMIVLMSLIVCVIMIGVMYPIIGSYGTIGGLA